LLEYMGIRFQPHMHGWLRVAVQNGHYDLVETLLDRGALVESALLNEAPLSPQSSLYQAARKNYHRTLRLLLERGCDVNEMAKHTLVPAMKYGHLDLIAMLFERGLRLNDAALWTLCLRLAVVKNQLNLLEQLLELGVPADAFDEHALLVAVARKRAATVNLLLQYERNKGIDVSVPILASRLKVISKAASRGYRDTLQLLVTHTCGGSEVRVLQVLHHAFEHAQSQHLGLYLTALLPMLSKSASDELLRAQVQRGVLSVVKALLQHGADVNAVSDDGLKACLASGNLPLWTLLKACQEDARRTCLSNASGRAIRAVMSLQRSLRRCRNGLVLMMLLCRRLEQHNHRPHLHLLLAEQRLQHNLLTRYRPSQSNSISWLRLRSELVDPSALLM